LTLISAIFFPESGKNIRQPTRLQTLEKAGIDNIEHLCYYPVKVIKSEPLSMESTMGTAPHYIFPGALLGSLILGILAFSLTAGVVLPENLTSPAAVVENSTLNESAHTDTELISAVQPDNCEVSSRYPQQILQWCPLITAYSLTNSLDPDLIAALIWQESGGDALATSKSGAIGLMQVMPRDGVAATFMCINGPCFANRPSIHELQDPTFNVEFGTRMLAGLQAKYGDLREALKSYGPKDVGYYYADKVLGLYNSYRE
jgi:hypothetical protein